MFVCVNDELLGYYEYKYFLNSQNYSVSAISVTLRSCGIIPSVFVRRYILLCRTTKQIQLQSKETIM